jgi:hypothetical protein
VSGMRQRSNVGSQDRCMRSGGRSMHFAGQRLVAARPCLSGKRHGLVCNAVASAEVSAAELRGMLEHALRLVMAAES